MRLVLTLWLVVGAAGCSAERGLLVQLSSNMAPGREIDVARVELMGPEGEALGTMDAPLTQGLGRPTRIANFRDLEAGVHRVVVTLLLDGRVVQTRRVSRDIVGTSVVTVLMTRDCNGVSCPAGDPSAVECLGGRCVPPTCDEEHPELCPMPECTIDGDCSAVVNCAPGVCSLSGTCFERADDDLCASGQVCDSDMGCLDVASEADAGGDAGRADAGVDASDTGSDAGSDGGPDGGRRDCDPLAPFGTPVLVPELSSGFNVTLRFRDDELRGVFWTSAGGDPDIWSVTRTVRTEPFTIQMTTGLNAFGLDSDPTCGPDGSLVVFSSTRSGGGDLYQGIPVDDSLTTFGMLSAVTGINSTSAESQPYLTARSLYFVSDRGGSTELYRAARVMGGYGVPSLIAELSSGAGEADPALTADELVIYFRSDRAGGPGGGDVYRATRSAITDPFGTPVLVPEVSSTVIDGPSWVSPDDCRLYLSSDRTGTPMVYVATRP